MKKQPKKHYSVRKKNKTINGYSEYYERVMPKPPEDYLKKMEDYAINPAITDMDLLKSRYSDEFIEELMQTQHSEQFMKEILQLGSVDLSPGAVNYYGRPPVREEEEETLLEKIKNFIKEKLL